MKSINVNTIIKNITPILCCLIVVALLLPFGAASANVESSIVNVEAESASISGFTFVFSGGILGILFGLMPILILATGYVSQLGTYKKHISLGASVLGIVLQFLVPSQYSASSTAEYVGGSSSTSVDITYKFGFWIILLLFVLLAAVSAIQYFNLKGNAVFDTINTGEVALSETQGTNTPNVDFGAVAGKIGNVAKNVAGTVSKQAESVIKSTKEHIQSSQHNEDTPVSSQPAQQPVMQTVSAAVANHDSPAASMQKSKPVAQTPIQPTAATSINKDDSDYIMEQINKLFQMKEKGILTEEEFAEKKTEYLKML